MNDFKAREAVLEQELRLKDETISQLETASQQIVKDASTGQKQSSYLSFMEQRVEDCLEENRRYHAKYVDIRDFSYKQIEVLLRQLNSKKRN